MSAAEQKQLEVDPSYFAEIYIMRADGSGQKRLTSVRGYDGGPFFSPDGKRIIWRRFDETGLIANVFTMNPDGTDVRQITDFGAMSWAPYEHPSGEYIIFASNKLGFENFELFMGSRARRSRALSTTTGSTADGTITEGRQMADAGAVAAARSNLPGARIMRRRSKPFARRRRGRPGRRSGVRSGDGRASQTRVTVDSRCVMTREFTGFVRGC